jgi:alpha-1,3-rhamnosyl/mannosyltransferase
MNVLINGVTAVGARTGIGRYALNLIEGVASRAPDVRLWVNSGLSIVPAERFLAEATDPTRIGLARRLRSILKALPFNQRLRSYLYERAPSQPVQFDLYHEPNYVPIAIDAPTVVTVCDLSLIHNPEYHPKERAASFAERLDRAIRGAERIVTISEFSKAEILDRYRWLDESAIAVIYPGVDRSRFYRRPKPEIDAALAKYGLGERYLLFLGTLEPRKNLNRLIEAHDRLPESMRRAYPLALAGGRGWRDADIRNAVARRQSEGSVHSIGYVDDADLPALISGASLFCFPSLYEGFGLPPLEAAACGAPTLCSNVSSLPEVMGDAAEYVDPIDVGSIADGLARLIDDEERRNRLIYLGERRVERFDWNACVDSTVAVYRSAVNSSLGHDDQDRRRAEAREINRSNDVRKAA